MKKREITATGLWFDVEKKNYTTKGKRWRKQRKLWFDVEKKNYTTKKNGFQGFIELWFDVEKKNYTTTIERNGIIIRCGLM